MPSFQRRWFAPACIASLLGAAGISGAADPFEIVYAFVSPPAFAAAALVRASDGSLYGTTAAGGDGASGTVFRLERDGTFRVLHHFRGDTDGRAPQVPLVEGPDGALYGLTLTGGSPACVDGCGTIFKVDPSGAFAVVHSFAWASRGGEQAVPLIRGRDGTLYGVTPRGGAADRGSIFAVDAAGHFSVLHSFGGDAGQDDGSTPVAPLVQDEDGSLYGSTPGTLFRIDAAGVFTTLHRFGGADGASPSALVRGGDGAFYGTTPVGGLYSAGTVFRIESTGRFTSLHSLEFDVDGGFDSGAYQPWYSEPLVRGADGALYGSTPQGGTSGCGTLFSIDSSGGFRVIHTFDCASGRAPHAPLVLAGDGDLYGSTSSGGAFGFGTLFRLRTDVGFQSMHSFQGRVDGASPGVPLVEGSDGALWGAAASLGPHAYGGTLFRLDVDSAFSLAHAFGDSPEGREPVSALVPGGDGSLYGMTPAGGAHGIGTLFRIERDAALTVIHDFEQRSGYGLFGARDGSVYGSVFSEPSGSLFRIDGSGRWNELHDFDGPREGAFGVVAAEGADGTLYGTAATGGSSNQGTVFRLDPSGRVTALHHFQRYVDGSVPRALTVASDGALYGVTSSGSGGAIPFGAGTLFRIDSSGAFLSLHSFSYVDGAYPESPLVEAKPGQLYGTNRENGPFGAGTAFKLDERGSFVQLHGFDESVEGIWAHGPMLLGPDAALYGVAMGFDGSVFRIRTDDQVEVLHRFDPTIDGRGPGAPLTLGNDGFIYGRTFQGGAFDHGTVFRIGTHGTFEVLHTLDPAVDGGMPVGPLTQGSDGAIYGTTSTRGPFGGGTVFRIRTKSPQSITFEALPDRTYGDATFALDALASSGLPMSYAASGTCSVAGNVVTLTGAGACRLTASQAGDADYLPAPDATRSFSIARGVPRIHWEDPPAIHPGTPLGAAQLDATASVPGILRYTPSAGTVLGVGVDQILSVSFEPSESQNYITATASVEIDVVFQFTGFLPPVANPPGLNRRRAGSIVATGFILAGNQGRDVLRSAKSSRLDCRSRVPMDGTRRTEHGDRLVYDWRRGRYIFLWETDRRWAGSCRQLVLTLRDGSVHRANFEFEPKLPHGSRSNR